jgi:hypothetical protein
MVLQLFEHWPLFRFLNTLHSRKDSLGGETARRKPAAYTQNNMNTEYTHTDTHEASRIRTNDASIGAGEDG